MKTKLVNLLRINMGSDISIINSNFVESCKPKIIIDCNVKYPVRDSFNQIYHSKSSTCKILC